MPPHLVYANVGWGWQIHVFVLDNTPLVVTVAGEHSRQTNEF